LYKLLYLYPYGHKGSKTMFRSWDLHVMSVTRYLAYGVLFIKNKSYK